MRAVHGLITPEGRQEWRRDWYVPLAAMLGSGATTVHFTTLGIFIKPIMADTGWSLSQITAALMINAIIALAGAALVGRLLDRVGAGKVAVFGLAAYLAALAAVGFFAHSVVQWWIVWTVLSLAGLLVKTPVWVMPVAKRFDKSRGLAIGLLGCGLGLSAAFMPSLTQFLVKIAGWRMAYVGVAGVVAVIALPVVCAVFGRKGFDATSDARASARMPVGGLPGLTWQEAVRTRRMWQLAGSGFLVGAALLGVQVHLASMLQEKAMPPATVALVVGALGFSALLGRFVSGYLLDRFSGRLIGALAFLSPAISCLLYLQYDGSIASALAIVVIFGFATGAESDVLAFLTARYIGLRSYGVCFSIIAALLSVGSSMGPVAMARLHDIYGHYDGAMQLLIVMLLIGALLIATLGRQPDFEVRLPSSDVRPASPRGR
jgi:MFS family permease